MSTIIHCQEKLINSTLMKTWAIFYFAAEKSQISICCLIMCWFSPLGCLTDVHHNCRYLKVLLSANTFVFVKTAQRKTDSWGWQQLTSGENVGKGMFSPSYMTHVDYVNIFKQRMYINIDMNSLCLRKHPRYIGASSDYRFRLKSV